MNVTLDDVARLSGVSKATVSRVLNNEPYVKEDTRKLILDAVKKLNYTPKIPPAFSAVSNRVNAIGVYPGISLTRLSYDPFYKQILDAIASECSRLGYQLTYLMEEKDNDDGVVDLVVNSGLKGFISWGCPSNIIYKLKEKGIPQVVVNQHLKWKDIPKILIDDHSGAYQAASYLMNLGHENIGFIGGIDVESMPKSFQERLNGYKCALVEGGLRFDEDFFSFEEMGIEPPGIKAGYLSMKELIDRGSMNKGMTAVIAANDLLAIGAIHYLCEMGMKIPKDISIVGFDNISSAEHVIPPLTTVNVPRDEMGKLAMRECVRLIEGKQPSSEIIKVEVTLVIRESCKNLNGTLCLTSSGC